MNLNHFTQYSIKNLVAENNPFTVIQWGNGLYSQCFRNIVIFIVMNYEAKLMWKHITHMKFTWNSHFLLNRIIFILAIEYVERKIVRSVVVVVVIVWLHIFSHIRWGSNTSAPYQTFFTFLFVSHLQCKVYSTLEQLNTWKFR